MQGRVWEYESCQYRLTHIRIQCSHPRRVKVSPVSIRHLSGWVGSQLHEQSQQVGTEGHFLTDDIISWRVNFVKLHSAYDFEPQKVWFHHRSKSLALSISTFGCRYAGDVFLHWRFLGTGKKKWCNHATFLYIHSASKAMLRWEINPFWSQSRDIKLPTDQQQTCPNKQRSFYVFFSYCLA